MSKHLVCYDTTIFSSDLKAPLEEVGHLEYIKRRVQFWKWRKKRTMGRPVLILWRKP